MSHWIKKKAKQGLNAKCKFRKNLCDRMALKESIKSTLFALCSLLLLLLKFAATLYTVTGDETGLASQLTLNPPSYLSYEIVHTTEVYIHFSSVSIQTAMWGLIIIIVTTNFFTFPKNQNSKRTGRQG